MQKKHLRDVLNSPLESRTVSGSLDKAGCYTANLAELLDEVGDDFVDVDGNLVKFDFTTVIKLINALWNKVKETAMECEGKEVQVQLPQGLVGQLIAAALAVMGIKI